MEAILRTIKPSPAEEATLRTNVNAFLKQLGLPAIIGGSYAKGTWLSGDHDIDLFIPYQKTTKNISDQLEKHLQKKFKNVVRLHGSRDYYQIRQTNITFEIVPVKKIRKADEAENITDVSPLHVAWVNKHTNEHRKDEVRLAKQFCKAHHLYGAETYIKGFSGYVLEILVVHYGNFAKLLKHSLHWKEGMVIDVAGHYHGINSSKKTALIIIDPVQASRNAAAALSDEKIKAFQKAARAFLQHPSKDAFIETPFNLAEIQKNDLVIQATPLTGKRDTVGTKLLKVHEYLLQKLEEEGYEITGSGWHWNTNAYFWYTVKATKLSKTLKHSGPPLINTKHLAAFTKKYKKLALKKEKGKVYVQLPRKYATLHDYAKTLLKENEIRERVKSVKIVQ